MAVAIAAYTIDGRPNNGGDRQKIGIYQVQAAWIATKKKQHKSNQNAKGTLRYDEILRQKGDCYFVDVNVTGSVEGTSDKPKFALRSLFLEKRECSHNCQTHKAWCWRRRIY
jgi:hypothetical protein